MFVILISLVCLQVGARRHSYFKHLTLEEVQIKGQLISSQGYPIGAELEINLQIGAQRQKLLTNQFGLFEFLFSLPSDEISGKLSVNVQDQFDQTFQISGQINHGQLDIGQLKIDNHQTESTHIYGQVYSYETKKPLENALVTLNYSQPLWLDQVNITTQASGSFDASVNLMKLLVYGVNIKIEMQGYKSWDCQKDAPSICQNDQGMALYNTYTYSFPSLSILLNPDYIKAKISVKIINGETLLPVGGIQVSVLCQVGDDGSLFLPQLSDSLGIVQLQSTSTLRRFDQFFCVIWSYTIEIKHEIIILQNPNYVWDGTKDSNLFIRI